MVQPGSHCPLTEAASCAATPGGQLPPLQRAQAWPPVPSPKHPGFLSHSTQPWQATSVLDIRGHPRVSSGGSCQAQAPGIGPSSLLLHSPLWHQSPEPCQPLGPGISPVVAHGRPDTPGSRSTGEEAGEPWPVPGPFLVLWAPRAVALLLPRRGQGGASNEAQLPALPHQL